MSFVIGLMTGYETSKRIEDRLVRQHIRSYLKQRGIVLTDRSGRTISTDEFLSQIMVSHLKGRTLAITVTIVASVAVVAAIIVWMLV